MANYGLKNYDIVILTHSPKNDLLKAIGMINKQIIRPQKLLLYNTDKDAFFNNFSVDSFNDVVKEVRSNDIGFDVIHIDKMDFDHGKSRNDATRYVHSDYFLFMTDDAIPYDEYLCKNLLDSFDKYGADSSCVAATYARQVAKDGAKLKEKYVREYNYPDYDIVKDKSKEKIYGIKNYFLSNVCAMYSREIFDKLGKFDEDIVLNEDTFYAYRAVQSGYKVVYNAGAKVYHSHNYTYIEQFRRNFDIGASHVINNDIFARVPSEKEGKNMILSLLPRFIFGLHFISLVDFIIECIFKFIGFKKGKNYSKLSIDTCVACSSNNSYFLRKM